jgi:hypothetical protein
MPASELDAALAAVVELDRSGGPAPVQVYSYEIDTGTRYWRLIGLVAGALFVGATIYVYAVSQRAEQPLGTGVKTTRVTPPTTLDPSAAPPTPVAEGTQPGATRRAPKATPTPVDVAGLRSTLARMPRRQARSLEQLAEILEQDLIFLKVPVREVRVEAPRRSKEEVVSFVATVRFADDSRDGRRRRVAIGLLVGRAMVRDRANIGELVFAPYDKAGRSRPQERASGADAQALYRGGRGETFLSRIAAQ